MLHYDVKRAHVFQGRVDSDYFWVTNQLAQPSRNRKLLKRVVFFVRLGVTAVPLLLGHGVSGKLLTLVATHTRDVHVRRVRHRDRALRNVSKWLAERRWCRCREGLHCESWWWDDCSLYQIPQRGRIV
ncbi:hypothetical protein FI667_g7821, partial [Globisporangium splendens]